MAISEEKKKHADALVSEIAMQGFEVVASKSRGKIDKTALGHVRVLTWPGGDPLVMVPDLAMLDLGLSPDALAIGWTEFRISNRLLAHALQTKKYLHVEHARTKTRAYVMYASAFVSLLAGRKVVPFLRATQRRFKWKHGARGRRRA